ncbi:protein-lysine 6-oxidase [Streptomyces sp. LBUM 1478]|uniref:lysyl oxidase family protein n=2 Tax=Streptomyces scabiei TaxID=1930 RepID=UPI001BB6A840|nr:MULTISPECIES: lysyl oxidase family protein [Streptomyces]MBP5862453.1 protein-lysine 6-oxidase [Streptomyces sp. LBUM 1484]MBP5907148.1 protein-lysine 6-oxidase [Streptomyces sp. LBUM 1478]MBP5930008.1 protein-lysine 6-oxidase [Streptomyces sp. LBUM 1479]MBP5877129.1 protein-lysine 6-oxidase [Streptomyces sp. LBUM 1477]MBP5884918.1 protein-lysine 6-oxidase [Streptomyces sp. LBUM 1487]
MALADEEPMTSQMTSPTNSPNSPGSDGAAQDRRSRLKRPGLAALASLTVVAAVAGAAPGAGAAPAAKPGTPQIKLIAASKSVTLTRWEGNNGVNLQLGTYLSVDNAPLEFQVTRKSYKDPIVAKQILRDGKTVKTRTLPAGTVDDFSGLTGFLEISVKDATGKQVAKTKGNFCPNNASGRIRPDAPSTNHYPQSCSTNPWTLGSVWGVEKGWATNTTGYDYDNTVDLPVGEYTAQVRVAKKYRDLFGIPDSKPTVKVTVRKDDDGGEGGEGLTASKSSSSHHGGHGGHGSGHSAQSAPAGAPALDGHHYGPRGADAPTPPQLPFALVDRGIAKHLGDGAGHTDGSRIAPALKANAKRPTGKAGVAKSVPKPDLRSLPAWDIAITDGEDGDVAGKDYLAFSANVWNAGPAPLVVDGFRKPGADKMDAYQYFYDAKGKQIGYTPTGTMEWDPREGHEHWHFTDFASYRLLSADQSKQVRSGKEAFCLANTDAIDYTVKNANWHPENTDLSTACGSEDAISVREVLDVGSGDTYTQYRPGQSFDITGLPNGTYYIQVIANPENRLQETNHKNNIALRKVVLGGTPGARTVKVPPHDLINAR